MNANTCREQILNTIKAHRAAIEHKPEQATPILGLAEVTALWEIAAQLAEMNAAKPAPQLTEADEQYFERIITRVARAQDNKMFGLHMVLNRVRSILGTPEIAAPNDLTTE